MRLRTFILIGLVFLISACINENSPNSSYRAINGKDTAELKLNINGDKFYGTYRIYYPGSIIDSGHVRGDIKGDTLIGYFRYRPYGMANFKRQPVAFLKGDDGTLIQGKGHVAVYMTVPYFWEQVPIKYDDPEFIFRPTN